MKSNISVIWKTAYRNLISDFRFFPLSTFFERIVNGVFSVLFPIAIYYLLFRKSVSGWFENVAGTSDYIGYVLIGQIISMVGFSSITTTGKAIFTESIEGTFDQVLLSPINHVYYFIGSYIEKSVLDFIEFIVMVLISYFLGLRIQLIQLPLLIVALLLVSLSGFLCSFIVITLFIHARSTYLIENTLFYIINLLAGVYYPIEAFPKPIQYLGNVIPITKCISIVRKLLLSELELNEFFIGSIYVIGISALYFLIGYYLFEKKYVNVLIEKVFN